MTLAELKSASAQLLVWLLVVQAAVNLISGWFPQWMTMGLGFVGVVWMARRSDRVSGEPGSRLARVTDGATFIGRNIRSRGRDVLFDVTGTGSVEVDGLVDEGPLFSVEERDASENDE